MLHTSVADGMHYVRDELQRMRRVWVPMLKGCLFHTVWHKLVLYAGVIVVVSNASDHTD